MFDLVPFRGRGLRRRGGREDFDSIFKGLDDLLAPVKPNLFETDVKESENEYVVEVDLPGVEKEDVEISYENKYLQLTANRKENIEEEREGYVVKERHYGEFKRSFYVPNVKEDEISADFKEGVLKIVLPKEKPGIEDKKIIDIN